jgi:hypothetical protein
MYSNNRYARRRPAAVYEASAAQTEGDAQSEKRDAAEQVYAMAYVTPQSCGEIFSDSDALKYGTLFPALYLPYGGGRRR